MMNAIRVLLSFNVLSVNLAQATARAAAAVAERPAAQSVSEKPIDVTDATFAAEVEHSPLPVIVVTWAEWCGPCRMLNPAVMDLSASLAEGVRFVKLNVDNNPLTAGRLNVRDIPTLIVFNGGREVARIVGNLPKNELAKRIETAVGQAIS